MKKIITKVSAAALSAAMVLGNGIILSAGAEGEETTAAVTEAVTTAVQAPTAEAATQAAETTAAQAETTAAQATAAQAETTAAPTTSVAPAASVTVSSLVGKWIYQVSSGNATVDKGAKDNGTVEIAKDGTYKYTDTTGAVKTGTVVVGTEEIGGTAATTVNFYEGSTLSFGGYYRSNYEISIGNGGMARLVRETATAATTTVAVSGTATTTKAAVTTTKANTNDSPKTGDSFPALAISAALLSAAALSITTKKRNK